MHDIGEPFAELLRQEKYVYAKYVSIRWRMCFYVIVRCLADAVDIMMGVCRACEVVENMEKTW